MRALVEHLGYVLRSWAAVARARASHPREIDPPSLRYTPGKGDLLDWYDACLEDALDVLRTTPEDATFWTFWPPQQNVAFLRRRLAHETSVHRWDYEAAHGDARPIDPKLAADGIDELLTVYLAAHARPKGAGEKIAFRATDTGDEWLLTIGDGELTTERENGDSDARLGGPANDLLLALWGRLPLERVSTDGDVAPLRRLLTEADFD